MRGLGGRVAADAVAIHHGLGLRSGFREREQVGQEDFELLGGAGLIGLRLGDEDAALLDRLLQDGAGGETLLDLPTEEDGEGDRDQQNRDLVELVI